MSLEAAIQRAGSPVELLRQSTARPHAFPVAPEFTNWRTEQNAWRTSCVLFDQSHHMTDLFLSGQDALKLLSRFGVNSFANFGTGKAKQYVAVNADGQFIGDAILFRLEDELFDVVGHQLGQSARFHQELAESLCGTNASAAQAAMREHVRYGVEETVAAIKLVQPIPERKWRLARNAADGAYQSAPLSAPPVPAG